MEDHIGIPVDKGERKMFCTTCGKKLADGAVFCPNCGSRVETAPARPAPAPAPAPVRPAPAPAPTPVQPAPVYSNPELANRYVAKNKKAGVWPVSCGVMGILALMFYLTGYVIFAVLGYAYMAFPYVPVIVFIAMTVVFFVHTRKIPWVTIFPFLIYLIFNIYQSHYFLSDVFRFYRGMNGMMLIQAAITLLPIIIFIFYVLITLIRPRGAALRVIFLILSLLQATLLFISPMTSLYSMSMSGDVYYAAYMILIRLGIMFFYIGYAIAGMNVRRPE